MKDDTVSLAQGKWRDILEQLGVDRKFLSGKNGPCIECGGKDRARFTDRNGSGTMYCSHCGARSGLMVASRHLGLGLAETCKRIRECLPAARVESRVKDTNKEKARCARIWADCIPIEPHMAAGRYLRSRVGFNPVLSSVRQHGSLSYYEDGKLTGKHPAMVARIYGPQGPVGLHITYLTPSGCKADVPTVRKILTHDTATSWWVPLLTDAHNEMEGVLGVAEGIETALAASSLFGVPVRAVLSEGWMRKFEWPSNTKRLEIYGDNDANFVGQAAAYALAKRAAQAIQSVSVMIPSETGKDWADEV